MSPTAAAFEPVRAALAAQGVTLVHLDDALLLVDKPAGLLAVPGRGEDKADCLSARVQAVLPEARVVHRLDQGTSGLMVLARGARAQTALSSAFAQRRVHKRYQALVRDAPPPAPPDAEGWCSIDLPLIVDWPNRPRSMVDHALGKPSLTRWRALGPATAPDGSPCTRLELAPVTGRSHQLRVHLMAIGHPILGDALYAPEAALHAAPRLCLHACWLELPHPTLGRPISCASSAPF